MKLFEHPDFEQAILKASEYFRAQGLRPLLIEKDYYVTEVPRRQGHRHRDADGRSIVSFGNLLTDFPPGLLLLQKAMVSGQKFRLESFHAVDAASAREFLQRSNRLRPSGRCVTVA
jgi:hypothetical protein